MLTLPFAHLNLRYNPFGELEPEVRARIAVLDLPPLSLGEVLQVMGEAGRGKTTCLLALAQQRPGSLYEYVPDGQDRYHARSFPAEGYLLDEAQRVRPKLLRRLFARAPRLVVATHEDLEPWSCRTVRTIRLEGLAQAKLAAVIERRLEAARRAPGPIPQVRPEQQQRLIDRFGDDLRAIESHLYDLFQRLEGPVDVEV